MFGLVLVKLLLCQMVGKWFVSTATAVRLWIVPTYEKPIYLTLLVDRLVYLLSDPYMAFKSVLRLFLDEF